MRRYTFRVGFRAALAALVAVLLLGLSSAGSACEASCGLKVFGAACHHSSTSASGELSGMHDCGMNSAGHSPSCVAAHTDSCQHVLCAQPSQALANRSTSSETAQAQVILISSVAASAIPPITTLRQSAGPPPLRSPLLISLQTPIRV